MPASNCGPPIWPFLTWAPREERKGALFIIYLGAQCYLQKMLPSDCAKAPIECLTPTRSFLYLRRAVGRERQQNMATREMWALPDGWEGGHCWSPQGCGTLRALWGQAETVLLIECWEQSTRCANKSGVQRWKKKTQHSMGIFKHSILIWSPKRQIKPGAHLKIHNLEHKMKNKIQPYFVSLCNAAL